MNDLQVTEYHGVRVLTTRQLAEAYETNGQKIRNNFNRNKDRYTEGKHYIHLTGEELRLFRTTTQIELQSKRSRTLYLWTEKGVLLHAKSLNTNKAWEAYDYLVDYYFRTKEEHPEPVEDIEPDFRLIISQLPIEALDKLEKVLRDAPMKSPNMYVLAEKMKRQL